MVNDGSHSKETELVLFWREQTTGLKIILAFEQWLGHAVQLTTMTVPPTMITPRFCSMIYNDYGRGLIYPKRYGHSTKAYQEAISSTAH